MPVAKNINTGTTYTGATAHATAIAAAAASDRIELDAGPFTGAATWLTTGLTIAAIAGESPVIDADGAADVLKCGEGTTLEDLTIHGATTGYCIQGNGTNRTINARRLLLRDAAKGMYRIATASVVERITFRDLTSTTFQTATSGQPNVSVAVVDGCAVGLIMPNSDLEHVTAYGIQGGTYAIHGDGVTNCIALDGSVSAAGIRATTYANNCSFGHATNFYSTPDAASIEADPLFVDPASGDFALQAGSPCRWSGAAATGATVDLVGVAFASVPSMGALEHVAAVIAATRNTLHATFGGDRLSANTFEVLPTTQDPLRAATALSIFTDRRDPVTGEGGWFANTFDEAGPIGSRLWLLQTEPITAKTPALVVEAVSESIDWMVDAGLVAKSTVIAERNATNRDRVDFQITHTMTDGTPVVLRFADLWGVFNG